MRSQRFVLLLLVGLSFLLSLTIIFLGIDADAGLGSTSLSTDVTPVASFPSKRDFQQSFSEERNNTSASRSFWEETFLYANATYHYRYSSKLFSSKYPILQDGNGNVLPSVLYGVCANAAKPVRRQVIRKSWGKETPVYFLVAGSWEFVSEEFLKFGDLLWVDIHEDYRNALTPKTFAFIHFASGKAIPAISEVSDRPVEYMFKTDDDVYINATEMSRELYVYNRPDYYGLLRNGTAPIRNQTETGLVSKWYMTREEYPYEVFPPYAHGTGYALSKAFGDCATKEMTKMLPMPWEDVATGLLAEACHIELAPSNEEWSHFLPFDSPESEWTEFPYHRFKNGSVLVKILHKVKVWFFLPLSQQASLLEAREYGGQKRLELRKKRVVAEESHKRE
jgi:hypothetical protein